MKPFSIYCVITLFILLYTISAQNSTIPPPSYISNILGPAHFYAFAEIVDSDVFVLRVTSVYDICDGMYENEIIFNNC